MARGRGGSYEPGVVTITRRRQLSLEPDIEFGVPRSRKTQLITDNAAEDADIISHKSRNRDRQLLNDITTRLVSSSNPYADQYPMRSTLPPITRQATVRRTVVTPSRLPESVLFVRAGSLPPPSHSRVEYYEEDIPSLPRVTPLPPRVTPVIKRPVVTQSRPIYRTMSEPPPSYRPIYRAASEPPPYRSLIYDTISEPLRPSVYYYERTPEPLYYPSVYRASDYSYRPTAYRTSPVYQPPPPSVYPTSRPYYRYVGMTPSSQNAVRNAKRYLDKIERELGMEHNGPIMAEPVVIHHVRQPAAARVVPRSSVRVATVGSAAPRYRSSSLPPSPRGVPRSSRVAQIEARLEQDSDDYMASPGDKPSETLSSLRTRATNIRNKMDAHKSMMDRYLPIYLGPENEVEYEVDYKFGELVNRMPTLDRHRPFQGSTSTAPVAPYKPASTTKPPSGRAPAARTNFRPPVSETRKRIREVMCATKKDPHYYD